MPRHALINVHSYPFERLQTSKKKKQVAGMNNTKKSQVAYFNSESSVSDLSRERGPKRF